MKVNVELPVAAWLSRTTFRRFVGVDFLVREWDRKKLSLPSGDEACLQNGHDCDGRFGGDGKRRAPKDGIAYPDVVAGLVGMRHRDLGAFACGSIEEDAGIGIVSEAGAVGRGSACDELPFLKICAILRQLACVPWIRVRGIPPQESSVALRTTRISG